jgi:hypothetical protein
MDSLVFKLSLRQIHRFPKIALKKVFGRDEEVLLLFKCIILVYQFSEISPPRHHFADSTFIKSHAIFHPPRLLGLSFFYYLLKKMLILKIISSIYVSNILLRKQLLGSGIKNHQKL